MEYVNKNKSWMFANVFTVHFLYFWCLLTRNVALLPPCSRVCILSVKSLFDCLFYLVKLFLDSNDNLCPLLIAFSFPLSSSSCTSKSVYIALASTFQDTLHTLIFLINFIRIGYLLTDEIIHEYSRDSLDVEFVYVSYCCSTYST